MSDSAFRELDVVRALCEINEEGMCIQPGEIGAIVYASVGWGGYEVEFPAGRCVHCWGYEIALVQRIAP